MRFNFNWHRNFFEYSFVRFDYINPMPPQTLAAQNLNLTLLYQNLPAHLTLLVNLDVHI